MTGFGLLDTVTVMDTYTPLFGKIIDSSLWDESDLVIKIFLTMLAKQDADHIVRGDAYHIGRWARKSEAQAMEALAILEAPDTKRLTPQPYDGRRIEKVPEGWLLLNGKHYQDLMHEANRRAYQRKKQTAYRARKKAPTVVSDETPEGWAEAPEGYGEIMVKRPEYKPL